MRRVGVALQLDKVASSCGGSKLISFSLRHPRVHRSLRTSQTAEVLPMFFGFDLRSTENPIVGRV
jgi:hypothetical protein